MAWLDERLSELREKKATVGLTIDEQQDLCELEGREQSINWERDYLNGEASL
jgi:hypothetical protein